MNEFASSPIARVETAPTQTEQPKWAERPVAKFKAALDSSTNLVKATAPNSDLATRLNDMHDARQKGNVVQKDIGDGVVVEEYWVKTNDSSGQPVERRGYSNDTIPLLLQELRTIVANGQKQGATPEELTRADQAKQDLELLQTYATVVKDSEGKDVHFFDITKEKANQIDQREAEHLLGPEVARVQGALRFAAEYALQHRDAQWIRLAMAGSSRAEDPMVRAVLARNALQSYLHNPNIDRVTLAAHLKKHGIEIADLTGEQGSLTLMSEGGALGVSEAAARDHVLDSLRTRGVDAKIITEVTDLFAKGSVSIETITGVFAFIDGLPEGIQTEFAKHHQQFAKEFGPGTEHLTELMQFGAAHKDVLGQLRSIYLGQGRTGYDEELLLFVAADPSDPTKVDQRLVKLAQESVRAQSEQLIGAVERTFGTAAVDRIKKSLIYVILAAIVAASYALEATTKPESFARK